MNDRQRLIRQSVEQEVKKIDELLNRVDLEASEKILSLLESLHLHQAELEMQNEELETSNYDNQTLRIYYNALFSLSPLASLVVDSRLHILETNQAAKNLLSLNRFSFVKNLGLQVLLDVSAIQQLHDEVMVTRQQDGSRDFELKIILKNETRICQAYLQALKIEQSTGESYLLILEDITDSVRLREQEHLFFEVLENADEMLFVTDHNGLLVNCTEHLLNFFDISEQEQLFKYLPTVIVDAFQDYLRRELLQRRQVNKLLELEAENQGQSRYISMRCFPILEDAEVKSIGVILNDDTQRVLDEQELSLALRIFQEGTQAIMVLDRNYNISLVNRAFEETTGYSADEILRKKPFILDSAKQQQSFYADALRDARETGIWEGEAWSKRKGGEPYAKWVSISSYPKRAQIPSNYIVVFRDITEKKIKEKEIYDLAFYDPLTNCGNRRKLSENIEDLIKQQQVSQFAFVFFDLDHFKVVNDIYGHEIGDVLLVALVNRIKKLIRNDDMMYRLGGDEFLILLKDFSSQKLWQKASELLQAARAPFNIKGNDISSGISIGIASYPKDGQDFTTLLKHADASLYKAKEKGRQRVEFFDPSILMNLERSANIERCLRSAFEEHSLRLAYMPIINADELSSTNVELLLRFNSPELGEIGPDEFIPIAERTGQIHELTEFVFVQAVALIAKLLDLGLSVPFISINISAADFKSPKFLLKCINRIPKQHRQKIKLEITEGVLLADTEQTQRILKQLTDTGAKLSIDDFGTQYSSLNYLSTFSVDEIKIDKSFLDDLHNSHKNKRLYKAILALIHALGCECVAEGVETKAQAEWLKLNNCQLMQGYYYSKPLSFEDYLAYLERC